jgi:hypothetical protein
MEGVMTINSRISDRHPQPLRTRSRRAPLCYARAATSDGIEQIQKQSGGLLVVLGAMTCAAVFFAAYSGWGF